MVVQLIQIEIWGILKNIKKDKVFTLYRTIPKIEKA